MSFKCNKYLDQHLKCKRHTDRINEKSLSDTRKYECSVCGKKYPIRQSLHAHTKLKSCVPAIQPIIENPVVEPDIYEKELTDQRALLETMQQKFDDQKNNIKAMQKKIDEIGILLRKTKKNESKNVVAQQQPQLQKSRDKRKKINKDVKQHIVMKQDNACGDCKNALTPYFEIDHIIGLQFGGTDDESNLMALCRECHAKKSIKENQCREQIKDAIKAIVRETLGIDQRI